MKGKYFPQGAIGWAKAINGAVAGREVKVDLKGSIQRGDPTCLIEVETA